MRRSLRRTLGVMLGLLAALWAVSAFAAGPDLLRTYPERQADGCDWVVAAWADGTYTSVPWNCPAGVTPRRAGTQVGWQRSYPQLEAGNCTWYVVQWQDGVYTQVPFSCPAGVTVMKDGTTRGTPVPTPVPAPPAPTPAPQPALQFPTANVTGTNPNCGVTDFRGFLYNREGNAVPGVTVRIRTTDGTWEALSDLSGDDGSWNLVVAPVAEAGQWQLYVEIAGQRQSPIVNAVTNGTDRCAPDSGGVQSVRIDFRQ